MSKKTEIENFVRTKIDMLQKKADSGKGKAMLANLRRGIGHELGEVPQLLEIFLSDMPEEFLSHNGNATNEEWACYVALTLYALHQQGYEVKSRPMHTDEEISLGKAMYMLVNAYEGDPNAEQRMVQKLRMLATSANRKELSHHLRGIVQLLKSFGISINYKKLAEDLYDMQFPEGKRQVCLKWGQDFYGGRNKKESNEEKHEEEKSI